MKGYLLIYQEFDYSFGRMKWDLKFLSPDPIDFGFFSLSSTILLEGVLLLLLPPLTVGFFALVSFSSSASISLTFDPVDPLRRFWFLRACCIISFSNIRNSSSVRSIHSSIQQNACLCVRKYTLRITYSGNGLDLCYFNIGWRALLYIITCPYGHI